jgi:hypothetical protein
VKIVVPQPFITDSWSASMPTECTLDSFGFEPVEGREVVAAFDGGAISSDAGALLLGATDRAIAMMDRFANCFHDERRPDLIEHEVVTLVGQRVFGIALGYEDLNDHDDLKNFFGSLDHDWVLRFVEHRVGDPRLISLIRRWLKAGVLEDGAVHPSEQGTPQGGSISVLLSNLYLHCVPQS